MTTGSLMIACESIHLNSFGTSGREVGEDEEVSESGNFDSTSLRRFSIRTASSIAFKTRELPSVSPRSSLTPPSSRISAIVFFNSILRASAVAAVDSAVDSSIESAKVRTLETRELGEKEEEREVSVGNREKRRNDQFISVSSQFIFLLPPFFIFLLLT